MKALTFSKFGNPEVLEYIDVPSPVLAQDEVLIELRSIGLNYADIYRRKGNYHLMGKPPYIAGYEGAGVVVDCNGNPDFSIGDRVCFTDIPFANAEFIAAPVSKTIPLPDDISFDLAASVLLQGLTAQYLVSDSYLVKKGDTVLIHAASGGVGQFLTQICKFKGAIVIGLTTSEHKKEIILRKGADAALNLNDDWNAAVLSLTNGKGVDVVYDSVGSTLSDSLAAARTGGHVVFFGMSGGKPDPVDPLQLMDSSKSVTGGDLWSYLTSKEERMTRSDILFDWIRSGQVKLEKPVKFKLSEGKLAHEFLENGHAAGKILLIP